MILGLGIDAVEIIRFANWYTYSRKNLQRIFSNEEINYCLQQINKSAERFAVRFAAREAFFKALCAAFPHNVTPFLTLCKNVTITKINGRPILLYNRTADSSKMVPVIFHLSMTHTKTIASAYVIIETI